MPRWRPRPQSCSLRVGTRWGQPRGAEGVGGSRRPDSAGYGGEWRGGVEWGHRRPWTLMSSDTHYTVLGLSEDASPEQIRSAWKTKAKETHPDANPDDASAEVRFKRANAAYEVLSDPKSRSRYDEELRRERQPPPPEPPSCVSCGAPTPGAGHLRCPTCEAVHRARASSVPRNHGLGVSAPGRVVGFQVARPGPSYHRHQRELEARYGRLGYWTRWGVPRWEL